jgi:hypothetical protein
MSQSAAVWIVESMSHGHPDCDLGSRQGGSRVDRWNTQAEEGSRVTLPRFGMHPIWHPRAGRLDSCSKSTSKGAEK